ATTRRPFPARANRPLPGVRRLHVYQHTRRPFPYRPPSRTSPGPAGQPMLGSRLQILLRHRRSRRRPHHDPPLRIRPLPIPFPLVRQGAAVPARRPRSALNSSYHSHNAPASVFVRVCPCRSVFAFGSALVRPILPVLTLNVQR